MKRFSDWPTRLNKFLDSRRDRKFKWGSHDCFIFTFDAIREITGTDLILPARGKYKSILGAHRLMQRHFRGGVAKTISGIAAHAGLKQVPILFAQRGDLVLLEISGISVAGWVSLDGKNAWVISDEEGLTSVFLLSSAVKAWRI